MKKKTIVRMLSSNKITFAVFCKHFPFFMTCKFIHTPPPHFSFLLSNSNSTALTARQLSGGGQEVWGALFIFPAGTASRL